MGRLTAFAVVVAIGGCQIGDPSGTIHETPNDSGRGGGAAARGGATSAGGTKSGAEEGGDAGEMSDAGGAGDPESGASGGADNGMAGVGGGGTGGGGDGGAADGASGEGGMSAAGGAGTGGSSTTGGTSAGVAGGSAGAGAQSGGAAGADSLGDFAGVWSGLTTQGKIVSFELDSPGLNWFRYGWVLPYCQSTTELSYSSPAPIIDGRVMLSWNASVGMSTQAEIVLESTTTASGTLTFTLRATPGQTPPGVPQCTGTETVTFTATRDGG
jgi:hypothetical protein